AMGAVLHPINIRLFPEQLAYVVDHAEDEVVLLDATLAPAFAGLLPGLRSVRHVVLSTAGGQVADDVRATLAEHAEVHDWTTVLAGASLSLPDRFLQAAPLAELIAAERPTHAGAVPTIWNDLLNHLDAHAGDVSSLREVLVGGSACPPALMRAFEERYGVRVVHA